MLQFYHDLGVLIYYGNNGAVDESLRNTVILKPQWLVDIFRKVITVNDIDEQVILSPQSFALNGISLAEFV